MNFQTKESSVSSDSTDGPENTASMNQLYENDIDMVIIKICCFLGDNSLFIIFVYLFLKTYLYNNKKILKKS